jgi:hypothetical protein
MQSLQGRLLDLVTRLDALGTRPSLVAAAKALKEARLTGATIARRLC